MDVLAASVSSLEILVPTIGGIGATLLGVTFGAAATSRSQRRQWFMQTQTAACSELLRESTKVFTALAAANLDGRRRTDRALINWDAWNQAMTVVDLGSDRLIVEMAHELDRTFWVLHDDEEDLLVRRLRRGCRRDDRNDRRDERRDCC